MRKINGEELLRLQCGVLIVVGDDAVHRNSLAIPWPSVSDERGFVLKIIPFVLDFLFHVGALYLWAIVNLIILTARLEFNLFNDFLIFAHS